MSQQELLVDVVTTLRKLQVLFMLTGSHASSLQGEARATHDIDFVVQLTGEAGQRLVQAFKADRYYLSETAVYDAIRSQRMFNLLETTTGEKVDFWILTDQPFDQSRFARRQSFDLGGVTVDVSSPEDTILMKLAWCRESGGSEKQFQDVLHIYELQHDRLDTGYLEHWVGELQVEELWRRVLDEAEPWMGGP